MRIFTVDIGTNTVLGLGVECVRDVLVRRSDSSDIVRLGEGLDRTGRLAEAAIERAVTALGKIGERIRAGGFDKVGAVATEAVRKAENSAAFLGRAKEALGVDVDVIDGEREARLSWVATGRSLPGGSERRTVVDIGGGSTELIIGSAEEDEPERAVSVPIGSVRLTERILKTDPASEDEKRQLIETVEQALSGAPQPEGQLVGIAGTVTSLAAICLEMTDYDPDRVHGTQLTRADVAGVVERLGRMRLDEKRGIAGLDPKRADVIYAGGVILDRVMERGGARALLVSDRGIRWGLAYEIAEREMGRRFH